MIGALATWGRAFPTMAQADEHCTVGLNRRANITAGTCAASVLDGETATATVGLYWRRVCLGSFCEKQIEIL